jgi:hypothetical protein
MCLTLLSCGGKNNDIIINNYSNANGFLSQTSDVAESENGYYILSGEKNSEKFISYIDKSSNEATVLCSKINCSHSLDNVPADCDSYVGSVISGSMNFYDGYVYYIGYDTNNYECTLRRLSANGSEHEMICKLGKAPDNSNEYYSYAVTDNYIIYSESIGNSDKKNNSELKIYDLKNKKVNTIYSYEDNNAKIFDLKVAGEFIYFRQANSDGFFESKLFAFNVKEQTADLVAEKVCSYSLKNENKIVYWKSFDGIYENSIDTREAEKIYNSDEDTMLGFLACVGENCYVYNFSNGSYKQDTDVFVGIVKDNEIVSRVYLAGNQFLLPLYIGEDRMISDVFGKGGKSIGYCPIENNSIDTNIINTEIVY